ncbi:tetratricopeptide repeat-containing sensor histidine kinase [Ferruginibacter sp. HRS2-29]|uniref:ATP-binding protein n=1 Tax=Ferruginibacter sp. HRS2-29 TaxID=2487334 RepID=UPI0020CECE43|nr:tetratricopeptide repeat-containing sensor histidine kinase [Ferruginibacter sp. HRS2-29]MCP9751372.1 hypothetical protein [Ferruginibacter sp. HRS2-29]
MKFSSSLLLVFFVAHAVAQNTRKADSLLNIVNTTNIDTVKIKALNELAKFHMNSEPSLSVKYIRQGLAITTEKGPSKMIGNQYLLLGNAYSQQGKSDTAKLYLRQAFDEGKKFKNVGQQIRALSQIGFINTRNAEYEEAAKNLFEALKMSEASGDSTAMSNTYNSICALYYDQSNFEKALIYGEKALQIILKKGSQASKGGSYLNVGLIYADMGNDRKAEEYYRNAISILEKSNNKLHLATVYGNLSLLRSNSVNKQIGYLLTAKKIWDENSPDHPNAIGNIGNLGNAYFSATIDSNFQRLQPAEGIVKDKAFLLSKAELYLKEAYDKCKEMNLEKDLHLFTGLLAKVEAAKGNYPLAYKYQDEFIQLNDSIYSQENKNKIAAVEGAREVAIRDKQIELNNISIAAQKKVRIYLIAGLLLLAVIGALLYRQSRIRRRTNTTLLKLNNELDEANKVKARFFGIISHDLRSPVASLVNFLNVQQKEPGVFSKEQEEKHRASLTGSAESLLETMEAMLQWSKSQMDNFKPRKQETNVSELFDHIRVNFPDEKNYTLTFQDPEHLNLISDIDYLKTIVHNLTANAIKALQGDKQGLIEWKAFREDGKIILSITDNGPGVNEKQLEALYNKGAQVNSKNGLGLHLIRDLTAAIGCVIEFSSAPGVGTTFKLQLK